METPNKMIGGIAGAMAQQTGAIDQTTGMAVQPGQIQPNPMINPKALGGAQENLIPGMFPGSAFQSKEHPGKDGHTGHLKDPVSGENKKVFDDSKKKKPMPKDEGTKKQQENKRVANLLNARSSEDLKK